MRAVIYARYSSDKQSEQSIEGQLRVCNEYANKNNLLVVNTYIDRAMTGKNDNRANFQQMLKDSANKPWDYVIVYKIDRFGRNKYEIAMNRHTLNANGIKLLSASENIPDTPEGIILESLLEGMAEYYSAELAQKTKRGMRESIIKGNFTGGHVLFGYKVIDKKIYVDKTNSEAMKFVFTEYANGATFNQIATQLNSKGYTYNGKPFKASSLQGKLNNKRYIGINEYEGEIYTNTYPAIIDNETFNKVQLMLKRNKKNAGANKAKTDYLLSGKLFCGLCGSTMVGTSGKSCKNKYTYYTCSNRYKKHECNKEYEQKDWLEDFVINKTLNYILKQNVIDEIVNNAYIYFKNKKYNTQIQAIEDRLDILDKQINKIYNIFAKTDSKEILKRANEEIKQLEIDKNNLLKELTITKATNKIFKTKEELKLIFDIFISGEQSDINFRKRIVKMFINSIFVFEDFIVIYYNLFDNNFTTFEEMQEHLQSIQDIKGVEKFNKVDILTNTGSQKSRIRTFVQVRFFYCKNLFSNLNL